MFFQELPACLFGLSGFQVLKITVAQLPAPLSEEDWTWAPWRPASVEICDHHPTAWAKLSLGVVTNSH